MLRNSGRESAPQIKIYLIARALSLLHPIELFRILLKIISFFSFPPHIARASRFQADTDYLIGPNIVIDENGLDIAKLGLEFRVGNKHFRQGDMKLKCLATIATVYKQSNEESVVGDESVLKTSIMESRETRAQSHTREDLTNGKDLSPYRPLTHPTCAAIAQRSPRAID